MSTGLSCEYWYVLPYVYVTGSKKHPLTDPRAYSIWSVIKAEWKGSLSSFGQDFEISPENNFHPGLVLIFLIQLLSSII